MVIFLCNKMDWGPFILSFKLALVTTLILLFLGVMLTFIIHFYSFRLRPILKALVSLPLVLPPTVLGYYLLVALQPESILGRWADSLFGIQLVFSFPGLVVASVIYSLPFMVNPIISALEGLPKSYEEASFTLGKTKWQTFRKVLLPNIKPSLWVASTMAFAHTIGEFGVILMIGGNIPNETRVASVAIYNEVETLNYSQADFYALILLLFSFIALALVYLFQERRVQTL